MPTYTSTLPSKIIEELGALSEQLKMPKNKIIEKALTIFLDQYKRAQYIESFKRAATDMDLLSMAEEGMGEYLSQIDSWDETS